MANHPYSSPPDYQPDDNWQASALCAQVDAELFFSAKGGNPKPAQRICPSCPVITQCNDHALTLGYHATGIWAGMTPRERQHHPDYRRTRGGAA